MTCMQHTYNNSWRKDRRCSRHSEPIGNNQSFWFEPCPKVLKHNVTVHFESRHLHPKMKTWSFKALEVLVTKVKAILNALTYKLIGPDLLCVFVGQQAYTGPVCRHCLLEKHWAVHCSQKLPVAYCSPHFQCLRITIQKLIKEVSVRSFYKLSPRFILRWEKKKQTKTNQTPSSLRAMLPES